MTPPQGPAFRDGHHNVDIDNGARLGTGERPIGFTFLPHPAVLPSGRIEPDDFFRLMRRRQSATRMADLATGFLARADARAPLLRFLPWSVAGRRKRAVHENLIGFAFEFSELLRNTLDFRSNEFDVNLVRVDFLGSENLTGDLVLLLNTPNSILDATDPLSHPLLHFFDQRIC